MKRKDMILIVVILMIAVSLFLIGNKLVGKTVGDTVVVYKGEEKYGSYPLQMEETITIGGTNTLLIKDGKADMLEADCPDKLCVHQKAISKPGENIICLPNKIVVKIEGSSTEKRIDAIVQ